MKKLDQFLYFYRFHEKSLTTQHTEAKVQEQVEKIRERYIAVWKRHYYRGRKYFYAHQKTAAGAEILRSIFLNPFHYESWRLLALLTLNQSIVNRIKTLKASFKK